MAARSVSAEAKPTSPRDGEPPVKQSLDYLPPIYILPSHIDGERRHNLEDQLLESNAPLTYDIAEARIVVGNVRTTRRAELELRLCQLWTEPVDTGPKDSSIAQPDAKRRRIGNLPESEGSGHALRVELESLESHHVYVVRLEWLEGLLNGASRGIRDYLVYEGQILESRPGARHAATTAAKETPDLSRSAASPVQSKATDSSPVVNNIAERARADAQVTPSRQHRSRYAPAYGHGPRKLGHHDHGHAHSAASARLLQQTTSDYEGAGGEDIPEPPEWVKKRLRYACERSTPAESPNAAFIAQLEKIRLTRILTDDEIGVRAYSTSIAAVAAYPYHITQAREILQLPGCNVKIANLWVEWKNNDGRIRVVEEAEEDEAMNVLRDFYGIWGVGATTAREFYFDRGWRDRDDIVEFGWQTLSRVQQIGVKYYDEFLQGIPRAEVEQIAAVVREHAVRVRDTGIELLVVGGYRRGKERSGDVDMIVSHRDVGKTANLVMDIVASLEAEEWITHTLLLSLNGTQRGQSTLPFKGLGHGGHGFDTLDKALVVWQDPSWEGRTQETKKRNPNPHRRVDIIISPWRTVGCAVMGWSGGTTFQRDLRRFAKSSRGWKFDSSGVRSRTTGMVIDLEGPSGVEGSMVDAEKAVFRGLGLEYREPWERCTH